MNKLIIPIMINYIKGVNEGKGQLRERGAIPPPPTLFGRIEGTAAALLLAPLPQV